MSEPDGLNLTPAVRDAVLTRELEERNYARLGQTLREMHDDTSAQRRPEFREVLVLVWGELSRRGFCAPPAAFFIGPR